MIRDLTQEAEVGKTYLGKVQKIMDFGAFVEIFPGTDGVLVKVLEIDRQGKIKLSRKDALNEKPGK